MNIRERLGKELLFLDGGMGTLLQAEGLAPGELPETWNIEHPEKVEAIHRRYYEAGSDVVLANTFGANICKFHDDRYTVEEVIRAGIANAKRAGEQIGKETYVALDMGPTGKLLKPMGDLDFDDAYEAFAEAVRYGEKYGADLIHIETMSDTYEVKAAILAAKENSSLPVFVTMIFDERGKLLTGGDVPSVVAGRTPRRCTGAELWTWAETDASNPERFKKIYLPSDHCEAKCRTSEAEERGNVLRCRAG